MLNNLNSERIMNMFDKLKKYFEETPNDKINEDWEKSKALDEFGIRVDDFMKILEQVNGAEQSDSNCNIPLVVGRSEQLVCDHNWKQWEDAHCNVRWRCTKCKEVR